jgi:hypothetical protein
LTKKVGPEQEFDAVARVAATARAGVADTRVEDVEVRLDVAGMRPEDVEVRLDVAEMHLEDVEAHVRVLGTRIEDVEVHVRVAEARPEDVEARVRVAWMRLDVAEMHLEDVAARPDVAEMRIEDVEARVRVLGTRIEDVEAHVRVAEARPEDVQVRLGDVDARGRRARVVATGSALRQNKKRKSRREAVRFSFERTRISVGERFTRTGTDDPGPASNDQERTRNTIMRSKYRIALNLALLDDAEREHLVGAIQKVAPQSPLAQNPSIAASLAAIGTKGAALASNVAAVASNTQILKASATQRDLSRDALDAELVTLKTLTENNATSPGDVTGMGFTILAGVVATEGPPQPPAALLVKTGRMRRQAIVTVAARGYQGQFAAQVSPDPIGNGTWTVLPGSGKSRKLTGYASGTRLWVQFAAVRRGVQSAWCTPVLVTIP